ncbi:hypothetical protein ACHAPU_002280 [Fusarium lateritium]
MAQKGGLSLPMYQREALLINFKAKRRYAIRIFVGGINAVSGEPAVPNAATALRRHNLLKSGKSLQDYVVVPGQRWLDGMAVKPGQVRQFVAMPVGSGHSVEAQMTGQETAAGIQFEITRLDLVSDNPGKRIEVIVLSLIGKGVPFMIGCDETVESLKELISVKDNIPIDDQRIIFMGRQLEVVHLVLRLRGGGNGPSPDELSISAGGRISQHIVPLKQRDYRETVPVTFNVQVLNSVSFERVTGREPPKSPVTAHTYAACGYPFFSLYEEPTTVSGNFFKVRSVGQIDRSPDQALPCVRIVDVETRKFTLSSLEWTCNECGHMNQAPLQQCDGCLGKRPPSPLPGTVGITRSARHEVPFMMEWDMRKQLRHKSSRI